MGGSLGGREKFDEVSVEKETLGARLLMLLAHF